MKNILDIKKSFLFMLIMVLAILTYAYRPIPNYVRGNVICQVQQVKDLAYLSAIPEIYKTEILTNNLVLISFDYTAIDEQNMVSRLLTGFPEQIIVAQKNHKTELRNTPNDFGFVNQGFWDLIKATDAWNKTTGGVSKQGDTIVLAMIDDGLDSLHEDIQHNIWRNRAEIPYDGIDNDGNGYIDDYNGWNAYTSQPFIQDNIEKAVHGTAVAGLMGADGNNLIGVTGGNWHVKILTVVGGSADEAENIKAFQYVLVQKKLYLETNGTKGAYVVALNCSWGISGSGAFAADAPLWCAFYDTLGKYGITTVGATSNSNVDVAVVGDLPSLCPSNHLVMVTNVNASTDLKVNSGYNVTHVDLGSIGNGTYSLCAISQQASCGKPYRSFSGTSGATPVTTALFGLLYSYACDSFIALSRSNPAEASTLAKKWVLDGVDTNSSLAGITVTGGRVNYDKALMEANKWCTSVNQPIQSVGIIEKAGSTILVYPNPSKGELTIESPDLITAIKIMDMNGRLVYELATAENKVFVALAATPGLYLVAVTTSHGTSFEKVVIE